MLQGAADPLRGLSGVRVGSMGTPGLPCQR